MKLRFKDIAAIIAVAVLSLPIMYLAVLFATDNIRVEFFPERRIEKDEENLRVIRQTARRDSLAVTQLEAYQALRRERAEIEKEREQLRAQQERINLLSGELEQKRNELQLERQKLEALVAESDTLRQKRIKQLARVYGAMKANEAASILETLGDDLVIQVINNISDDRQRAKILAALSEGKAARMSKKMGAPIP
jgi:flagellar motility protein MotE (MotC chaperone)